MRQGRRVRWCVGALGGFAALVASTWGTMGCDDSSISTAVDSHTVTVNVQTASRVPAVNAVVTVWIVDADLPGTERAPIVLGTAATDSEGTVQFTYNSVAPPYVCGYEVKDAAAQTVLVSQPPAVTNDLATPSGYLPITLP